MSDVERERVTALWREAAAALEQETEFGAGRGSDTKGAGSPDIPRPTTCAECGRLREQLDATREALEQIAGTPSSDWHLHAIARAALGFEGEREQCVTHGRHCSCSACAQEDWTRITAPCGMHGEDCPAVYAPLRVEGEQ